MFRKMTSFEVVSCIAVVLMLAFGNINADDGDYAKQRRSYKGVSGLTPFPRTGRSDPDLFNWDNVNGNHLDVNNDAFNSFEEYEDYPTHIELKRSGLIPFPRVGRSGPSKYASRAALMQGMKRGAPGSGNAMWFGPRLGRIQKRSSSTGAKQEPTADVFPLPSSESNELSASDIFELENPMDGA